MKSKPLVVLLSVGSYAKISDLVYSQMLKLGDFVCGGEEFYVKSYVYFPLASCVKRYRHVFSDIKELKSKTKHEIGFGFTFIRWAGALSFFSRAFLVKPIVARLQREISRDLEEQTPIILHCRNYYSAFVALQLREQSNLPISVVFDTRGLMPYEVPYISGMGSLLFGPFHQWEHELIEASDIVLVQARKSKEYLDLIHGNEGKIRFLPISGFPEARRERALASRFEAAWKKKQFLYVGSLGHWNDFRTLLDSFTLIASAFEGEVEFLVAATEPTSFSDKDLPFAVRFTSVPYDSIHTLYNESLAIIIGGSSACDFFSNANMRVNYFSTKAVEALSLGVPLLVNQDLTELADFVCVNGCGYTININDESVDTLDALDIAGGDKSAWALVSENAAKVGCEFLAESVHSEYSKMWEELV